MPQPYESRALYRMFRQAGEETYRRDVITDLRSDFEWFVLVNNAVKVARSEIALYGINQKKEKRLITKTINSLIDTNQNWGRNFDNVPNGIQLLELPIDFDLQDNQDFSGREFGQSGYLNRIIQYTVDELQRKTPSIAIEALRGGGKDSLVADLVARMEKAEIPVRAAKLSGFLDTREDWTKYFDSLSSGAKKTLKEDIINLQRLRGGNVIANVTKFIKDWEKRVRSQNLFPSGLSDRMIFEAAVSNAEY